MTRSESSDSIPSRSTGRRSARGNTYSTPPTSTADSASVGAGPHLNLRKTEEGMRSLRPSRSTIHSYNENVLSGTAKHGHRKKYGSGGDRTISGETLVEDIQDAPGEFAHRSLQGFNRDWKLSALPGDYLNITPQSKEINNRKSSRLDIFELASNVVEQTRSVLGKRRRETTDLDLEKTRIVNESWTDDVSQLQIKTKASEGPRSKRARTRPSTSLNDALSSPLLEIQQKPTKRVTKLWLNQGLYVGQDPDFDPRLTTSKNRIKKASAKGDKIRPRSLLPLPMFAGRRTLENGRPFKLPFDVFSPLPPGQPKPDEWKKTRKNVFIGDAAAVWRKNHLEPSQCVCDPDTGCDHDCLNRLMLYECDDINCNLGAERCGNRSFEDLRQRNKAGGRYNIGVDVIKTSDRGYGVRSNRTFEPGQIIVEYTGEIITQDECDDRMENRYKDNECFYLMNFDQKMILDATRGSIARFVNHSCEPNCKMIKMVVSGKPRMALFAGKNGIMTGEELTYDYNFSPYSLKNVQACRCGAPSCRGVLGPKPKEIKDALEPIATGGKRKFQQAIEDGIDTVVTKKRKINIASGVHKALHSAKMQTNDKLTKARMLNSSIKKESPREEASLVSPSRRKSTSVLERGASNIKKTSITYSRRRASASTISVKKEAKVDDDRPLSRKGTVKTKVSGIRKNVVRTVKRSGRGDTTPRDKSIRVIRGD